MSGHKHKHTHKRFGLHHRGVRSALSVVVAALLILSISYLGVKTYQDSQAAAGGAISLTPSGGSHATGSTLSVTINEDSGTEPVNSVQASLTYDPAKLQYVSVTEGGSFPVVAATSTGTPGIFRVARATNDTPLTGIKPIVTVNFKILATSGTADIGIDKAYSFIASSTNNQDILLTVGSASFSVTGGGGGGTKPILTITPASGSYAVGANVAATVKLNGYTNPITTVQSAISYPTNLLQYVSVTEGSSYPTKQRTTASGGVVDIIRGIAGGSTPITGDNTVVTINFKVLAAGTATLGIGTASAAYDNSGTGTNILDKANSKGAAYTLGSTTTTPPPTPTPTPTTPPPTTTNPVTGLTSPGQGATIAPTRSGSASLITQSDGSVVPKLEGEVNLGPAIESGSGTIKSVEYYLGTKLVATETDAPFTYTFDTTKIKNGKYVLRIKTTYSTGVVDTRSENMVIRNKVGFGYVMQHYGLSAAGAVGLMAVVGVFLWKLVIPKFGGHGGLGGHGGFGGDADKHGPSDHPGAFATEAAQTESGLFSDGPSGTADEPTIVAPQTPGGAAPGAEVSPTPGAAATPGAGQSVKPGASISPTDPPAPDDKA